MKPSSTASTSGVMGVVVDQKPKKRSKSPPPSTPTAALRNEDAGESKPLPLGDMDKAELLLLVKKQGQGQEGQPQPGSQGEGQDVRVRVTRFHQEQTPPPRQKFLKERQLLQVQGPEAGATPPKEMRASSSTPTATSTATPSSSGGGQSQFAPPPSTWTPQNPGSQFFHDQPRPWLMPMSMPPPLFPLGLGGGGGNSFGFLPGPGGPLPPGYGLFPLPLLPLGGSGMEQNSGCNKFTVFGLGAVVFQSGGGIGVVDDSDLASCFSQFGVVREAQIVGKLGFVTMGEGGAAERILTQRYHTLWNGIRVDCRRIVVSMHEFFQTLKSVELSMHPEVWNNGRILKYEDLLSSEWYDTVICAIATKTYSAQVEAEVTMAAVAAAVAGSGGYLPQPGPGSYFLQPPPPPNNPVRGQMDHILRQYCGDYQAPVAGGKGENSTNPQQ